MPGKKLPSKPTSRGRVMFGALLVIIMTVVLGEVFSLFKDNEAIPPATQPATPLTITVAEAYQEYQQGVFFLDVRELEEWDASHIPDSTLIPLGELPDRLNELPCDRQIVVVCRSGNRSQGGRDILLAAGFVNVASMAGGLSGWSNAGYPLEATRP